MVPIVDISEVLLELGLSAVCTEEQRAIANVSLLKANAAVLRHLKYNPVYGEHTEYLPGVDARSGASGQVWEVNENSAYVRSLASGAETELQLSNIPIRSISSLRIDYDGRSGTRSGAFGSSTAKTEGSDFWANYDMVDSSGNKVCRDGILRSEGLWPSVAGSVKIVYTAGYTVAELHGQDAVINAASIAEAVIDEAVRRFLKIMSRKKKPLAGFAGPLTSENLGAYSYSVDTGTTSKLWGGEMDMLPETEHKLQDFVRMDLGVI